MLKQILPADIFAESAQNFIVIDVSRENVEYHVAPPQLQDAMSTVKFGRAGKFVSIIRWQSPDISTRRFVDYPALRDLANQWVRSKAPATLTPGKTARVGVPRKLAKAILLSQDATKHPFRLHGYWVLTFKGTFFILRFNGDGALTVFRKIQDKNRACTPALPAPGERRKRKQISSDASTDDPITANPLKRKRGRPRKTPVS